MIADRMKKLFDKKVFKLIFLLVYHSMILIFIFKIKQENPGDHEDDIDDDNY